MSSWENYTAPNAGWLFYKHIYQENSIKEKIKLSGNELKIDVPNEEKISPFDAFYKDLYKMELNQYAQIENPVPSTDERFTLFTTYPGLLVGSGYPHDTKAKGDFKIGFYFDHTTGQPVIPGSSVKGVLRSVFELDVNSKGKNFTGKESVAFVKWLLEEINQKPVADELLDATELKNIKREIFGDEDKPGTDIFFDAVINIKKTKGIPFLANDFITSHYHNLLKNPNPIQFLKVLPSIGFEFRFKLSDKTKWEKDLKRRLFQKIILTLGIGAKTNVGYGQFSNEPIKTNQKHPQQTHHPDSQPHKNKENLEALAEENRRKNHSNNEAEKNRNEQLNLPSNCPVESSLSKGDPVNATIAGIEDKNLLLMFHVAEKSKLKHPFPDKFADYQIGQTLSLIVSVMIDGKIKGVKKQKN